MPGNFFFRQANPSLSRRLLFPRYKQIGTSSPTYNINDFLKSKLNGGKIGKYLSHDTQVLPFWKQMLTA